MTRNVVIKDFKLKVKRKRDMEVERALRISEKMRKFIEISKEKPTLADSEICTCPLTDLIEADKQAHKYNRENNCEKYMVVGDVFLSALYLCIHNIPQYFNAFDPILTVDNKTLFFYATHGKSKEETH